MREPVSSSNQLLPSSHHPDRFPDESVVMPHPVSLLKRVCVLSPEESSSQLEPSSHQEEAEPSEDYVFVQAVS